MSLDKLLDLIETHRLVMNTLAESGKSTEELLEASQELDKLITEYYRAQCKD